MSCAFGEENKFPSSPIQEKFIEALKRSLFQSPASSFLISEIGKMFKISKLPPK